MSNFIRYQKKIQKFRRKYRYKYRKVTAVDAFVCFVNFYERAGWRSTCVTHTIGPTPLEALKGRGFSILGRVVNSKVDIHMCHTTAQLPWEQKTRRN